MVGEIKKKKQYHLTNHMDNKLLKEAFRLRFEYYNLYENCEHKWHKKYKNHNLYNVAIKSFEYDFKEIAAVMPRLVEEIEKKSL